MNSSADGRPGRGALPRGFSLVELLVVVAVVGTLVGLLLPAVQTARETARRSSCLSQLRQLGLGLLAHESAKTRLPAGYVTEAGRTPRDPVTADRPPGTGWGLLIAAYVEEGRLADGYRADLGIAAPENRGIVANAPAIFRCPSDAGPREAFAALDQSGAAHASGAVLGRSSYVGNAGHAEPWGEPLESWAGVSNGPLYRNSAVAVREIIDGASNTVCLGEHLSRLSQKAWAGTIPGAWSHPTERFAAQGSAADVAATLLLVHSGPAASEPGVIHPPNDEHAHVCQMYSDHPGGCNVMMCDGSARFVTNTIDPRTWAALSSFNGSEWLPRQDR